MAIGPTMTGKTCMQRVLMQTLENQECRKVHRHLLNPKIMTMSELYGKMCNNEWCDGILTKLIRTCCADTTNDEHWIVMDGEIDAIWVENLNTVLDDNKMLCLPTGERIKITPNIRFVF